MSKPSSKQQLLGFMAAKLKPSELSQMFWPLGLEVPTLIAESGKQKTSAQLAGELIDAAIAFERKDTLHILLVQRFPENNFVRRLDFSDGSFSVVPGNRVTDTAREPDAAMHVPNGGKPYHEVKKRSANTLKAAKQIIEVFKREFDAGADQSHITNAIWIKGVQLAAGDLLDMDYNFSHDLARSIYAQLSENPNLSASGLEIALIKHHLNYSERLDVKRMSGRSWER